MQHTAIPLTQQYIDVCRILSTECKDSLSVKKLICVNLRSTDKRELYTRVFDNIVNDAQFLDWDKIESTYKSMSSSVFWCHILDRFCGTDPYIQNSKDTDTSKSMILKTFEQHMKRCTLPTDWKTVIFTFLLANIERVEGTHVIESFLSRRCDKNVATQCMQLMAMRADIRYTPDEYKDTIKWVIGECLHVNEQILRSDIEFVLKNVQESKDAMIMKTIQVSSGRMRLRERLTGKFNTGIMSGGFESFQRAANFSSSVSHNTQIKAYVIMSQSALDTDIVLNNVFPVDVAERVKNISISNPCLQTVTKFLDKISFSRPPFKELKAFHSTCFKSITISFKNTLMITHLMQLYIAIYQHPLIWKDCWTHVLPVMNSQLIRDVETFKEANPKMDIDNFIYALQTLH